MNSLLILSVLGVLSFSTVVAVPDDSPSFEPFDWEAGGSFSASGTFTGKTIFPPNPNPELVSDSSIALDVAQQRYVIRITTNHTQYGFANGTYYVDNGVCSFVAPNYTDFVNVYKAALQITQENIIRVYSGLIHEMGACNQNVMVTMIRAQVGPFKKLISFSFSQVLNLAVQVQLPPTVPVPGKVFATIRYDTYNSGTPAASNFQLPPSCYANPAAVLNYCNIFYNPALGYFNTPY